MQERKSGTARVEMLGGIRVFGPDRQTLLLGPLSGALLSMLAVSSEHGRSTQDLAMALWPNEDEDSAQQKLDQRMSVLRRELSGAGLDPVHIDGGIVRFDHEGFRTDVADFEKSAVEGLASESVAALERAVQLYRGPLLPIATADWIVQERRRLEEIFHRVLAGLAKALMRANEIAGAIQAAKRLVSECPSDPESHWLLMELTSASGRVADVKLQYSEMEKVFRQSGTASPRPEDEARYIKLVAEGAAKQAESGSAAISTGKSSASSVKVLEPARRTPNLVRTGIVVAIGATLIAFAAVWVNVMEAPSSDEEGGILSTRTLKPSAFALTYRQESGQPGYTGPAWVTRHLKLTDGHSGISSAAWFKRRVRYEGLSVHFKFRVANPTKNPGPLGDGFAVVIQNEGATALGTGGPGVGYGGITNSAALKFGLTDGQGNSSPSTRNWSWLYEGGNSAGDHALDLDLGSGDNFDATIKFGTQSLDAELMDRKTRKKVKTSATFDLAGAIRTVDHKAYFGFTGGTSTGTSQIEIYDVSFTEG